MGVRGLFGGPAAAVAGGSAVPSTSALSLEFENAADDVAGMVGLGLGVGVFVGVGVRVGVGVGVGVTAGVGVGVAGGKQGSPPLFRFP